MTPHNEQFITAPVQEHWLEKRTETLALPVAARAGWSDLDVRAVDTARMLAADAVEKAGSGHPGTAMSLAPLAYLLFQNVMRHDPANDAWIGRDRLVLSCGHASLLLYVQLYLSGYGLELKDLQALRKWRSATPAHPEYGHTAGVEMTTGPLGQGFASAVGMAMAARRVRGLLDPDTATGESLFDHYVYVIASDGDLMEGVVSEASSIAGHQELGNLVVFYDQNHISIEDDVDITFTEDVAARYAAYGWHVQTVDWRTRDGYVEDVDALLDAIHAAQEEKTRPSLIALNTLIAWPAPNKQNSAKAHGSALGSAEVAATKELLGFDPAFDFAVEPEVLAHTRKVTARAAALRASWEAKCREWQRDNPERAELLERLRSRQAPAGWISALPTFRPDAHGISTRKASGAVLAALAQQLPELWGGSADLAESNNTTIAGEPSFVPAQRQTKAWSGGPYGRTLHFGVREHAMGAILNGIALHGLTRPYGGTFLTFSDYMRPSVRLAALMGLPVIYIWTHDSIGLGEDGPTHQPVEHLATLRAIPGLDVVRPGDANETAECWATILQRTHRPAALVLSRQNLPVVDRSELAYASAAGASRGGYVLAEASTATPHAILVATGSEVPLALEARNMLESAGIGTRVVSMPCVEWFDEQPADYRGSVLPMTVPVRISIEAGIAQGWERIVGPGGGCISVERFGASADAATLYEHFGLTPSRIAQKVRELAGRETRR